MNNQRAYYTDHRVRFEFRRSRGIDTNLGTIYAAIYVEGQGHEAFSTGIRASFEQWRSRTAPRRTQEAKDLNERLVQWESGLRSAARTLYDRGDPITAASLIAEKNYVAKPLLTLETTFQLFLQHKQAQVGSMDATKRSSDQISPNTFRHYSKRWGWVSRYLKHLRTPHMLLVKVDAPFIQKYYYYLTQQKIGAAYATNMVKMLTEVCHWAYRAGHIRELPTTGFRGTSVAQTPPHNVTEEQIEVIEALELTPDMAKIRDGWLLARELCLHYVDYRELKPEHFSRDSKGRLILEKYRVKQQGGRGIKIVSFVSERAQRIWQKYGERIPAKYTNVHMTRNIAEVGKQAGLERPLNFSHARDSGIFRLVAAGCPEVQIKLAAGWTSTKNLVRYVNHDRKLLEELKSPETPKDGQSDLLKERLAQYELAFSAEHHNHAKRLN